MRVPDRLFREEDKTWRTAHDYKARIILTKKNTGHVFNGLGRDSPLSLWDYPQSESLLGMLMGTSLNRAKR